MHFVRKIILLAILIVPILCGCKTNDVMKFAKISADEISETESIVFVNEGTSLKSSTMEINGITYKIACRNSKVVYVETRDKNFVSSEGLSINSSVAECLELKTKLEVEPGIGLFMRLKNGWRAYLSNGEDILRLSDNVKYFCCMDENLSHSMSLKNWIDYLSCSQNFESEELNDKIIFVRGR